MSTTVPLREVRTLAALSSMASAALIPLASDGIGGDSHGGRIPHPGEALDRALVALEQAGRLAGRFRADAELSRVTAGAIPE